MSGARATPPRYPEQRAIRPVLLPCVLGALVLVATLPLPNSDTFTIVQYVASILALIVGVIIIQRGRRWWALLMVPVVVVFQPVLPLRLTTVTWQFAELAGAVLFIVTGALVKAPPSQAAGDGRSARR